MVGNILRNIFNVFKTEISRMVRDIFGNRVAHHAPVGMSDRTKRFLVGIIAPSSDSLTDQKAHRHHVKKIEEIQLFDFTDDKGRKNSADDAAVNGKSALPDFDDIAGVSTVIIPTESNIKQSRPDDSENRSVKQNIDHFIQIDFPFISHSSAEQNGKKKAESDNSAVPSDLGEAKVKNLRHGKLFGNSGKFNKNGIAHDSSLPYILCAIAMTTGMVIIETKLTNATVFDATKASLLYLVANIKVLFADGTLAVMALAARSVPVMPQRR